MSLWWRKRVIIGLAPERLSALRLSGRWGPGILERYVAPLELSTTSQWQAGIIALELLLEEPAWRNLDVSIIVSGHYAHYAVVPKGPGLSPVEHQDLALLIFRNVFGDMSHHWSIRVSPPSTLPALASGVPQELLDLLQTACQGRGFLRSIQPSLMVAFNRARFAIGMNQGTLAVVEDGRITLALIDNGQWLSVTSRAAGAGLLPQLLAEEHELQGRKTGSLLWLFDLTGQAQLPTGSAWQIWRVPTPLNDTSPSSSSPNLADWAVA